MADYHHSSPMSGHFSGEKVYKALSHHWWWQGMYGDVIVHCRTCPQCAIVNASSKINKPPLHPIPVEWVFQITGVDVMERMAITMLQYSRTFCQNVTTGFSSSGPEGHEISSPYSKWSGNLLWCARGSPVRLWHKLVILPNDRCMQITRK